MTSLCSKFRQERKIKIKTAKNKALIDQTARIKPATVVAKYVADATN